MKTDEETIQATLDGSGQLQLEHAPHLPPGPVSVTIRATASAVRRRGLADVVREIAAEQRSRGFQGRSAEDLRARATHARPKTPIAMRSWIRHAAGPWRGMLECCITSIL